MRLFSSSERAKTSALEKKTLWMNSECPFISGADRLCGSWCAMFYVGQNGENSTPYVILGCKGTDKQLYVDEVIE